MQHIDIRRKRPSRWPWFAGAAILVLILWGTTALLAPDEEEEAEVEVPTVGDTLPPASIPQPPNRPGAAAGASGPRLDALGEDDVGEALEVEGVVVATGNDSFWLLAEDDVLLVESARMARKGDSVEVRGELQPADPGKTERMTPVLDRYSGSEQWTVIRSLKLVEEGARGGDGAIGALSIR